MELSEELIAKAKGTKTPEELAALAKESSIDLTEEEAKAYFEQLHPKTGELSDDELDNVSGGCHTKGGLSDDELDNVAGGGCHTKGGYLLTTAGYRCGFFEEDTSPTAFGLMGTCCRCRHWDQANWTGYETLGAPLKCLNPKNRRGK